MGQLISFMDALELGKVILVGNSYGATLAVRAALAYPKRIEGLVLVDAAVYVQEQMPSWVMNLPQVKRMGPLFARSLGGSDSFYRGTYLNPSLITEEERELNAINTGVTNWDRALWEYLSAWGTPTEEYLSRIPEIEQPTLIIWGEGDSVVPLSDGERLNTEIANSTLAIIQGSGHVPQEETPESFIAAVDPWLTQFLANR